MRIYPLILAIVLSIIPWLNYAQKSLDSLVLPIFNSSTANLGIKIQNIANLENFPSLMVGVPPYSSPTTSISNSSIQWIEGKFNKIQIIYTSDSLKVTSTISNGMEITDSLVYRISSPSCLTSIQLGITNFLAELDGSINLLEINSIQFNDELVNPDSIAIDSTNSNIFYKISDSLLSQGFKLEFEFYFVGNNAENPTDNSIEVLLGFRPEDPQPLNNNNTSFSVLSLDAPDSTSICMGESLEFKASGGSEYEFLIGENIVQPFSSDSIFIIDSLRNGQQVGVRISDGICTFTRNLDFNILVYDLPSTPEVIKKEANFCAPTSIISNKTLIVSGDTIRWKVVNAPSGSGLSFNQIMNPGFSNSSLSINSKGDSLIMANNPTPGLYQFVTQGYSNISGCKSEFSDTLTALVNLTPIILTQATPPPICSNQPINFSNIIVSNGVAISSYNFLSVTKGSLTSGPENKSLPANNQTGNFISSDLYLNSSGENQTAVYTILANGSNGCSSEVEEFGFKILAQPQIVPLSDTTLANGATLGKIFAIQTGYSARDTFRLLSLAADQDLVPNTTNKSINTLGNANFLTQEKWNNLNLRSRKVRYTVGTTNPEYPGFCSFSTDDFTATIAPNIGLSWAPDAQPFNPLDTVSLCQDNPQISFRLKPTFRLNQGEKMRLILLPVSEGSILPAGITSSLIKSTRDTFTITNIVTTFLTRTDNILLSTPILPATITYRWIAQWVGLDGTVLESEPILVNFKIVESDLIFSFDPNIPSQSGGTICSGENVSVELSGNVNLQISGISHSTSGANGPWLSGYGPLIGSVNYKEGDFILNSEINETLNNTLQQKVWLKYDVLSSSNTSAIQCNPYSSSFILAVQSGYQSTLRKPNEGRVFEATEKICASNMPLIIPMEWSAPVILQNGQRMAINLLGISSKSSKIGSKLITGTSIPDTINAGSQVKKIFIDTISILTNQNSPDSVRYVFESAILDSNGVLCKKDTLYQIFRIIPSPTVVLNIEFDNICSGNSISLSATIGNNIEGLIQGQDYFLALTDVKYSLTNQPGSWWNGYGPVTSSNPIFPGMKFNSGSNISQNLTHSQSYSVFLRFTFSAVIIGTDGTCTVSSNEYKVLVDPAPRFVNTLPNLSKKTSDDGSGNCGVGFTWNNPQIIGGNSSTLFINTTNPPTAVTPGQLYSITLGPGSHIISYSLVSGCDTKFTSFTITVTDDENPTMTCPANITINLNGETSTTVNYEIPVVSDNCIGTELLRIRGPIPGQRVEKGVYPVTFLGFDQGGRLVNCNFTITVNEGSPRSTSLASCEDRVIEVNSPTDECGTVVNYPNPDCNGDCSGSSFSRLSGLASGSIFPVGMNEVKFKLTDRNGQESFCNLTVKVLPPPSRSINCTDATLILPYGETYALKLTDFIAMDNVIDACEGMPTDVKIEPGQINCEAELSQRPISISWKNGMGRPESCQAKLSVTRTGKPEYAELTPSFVNTTKGVFTSDPCNVNAAFQLGVTTQSRNDQASGFAYTEVCGNMSFTTRIKSISGFGHAGIQLQGSSKTVTLAIEKSFEGIKQVIRLRATVNRGDGKGNETIAQDAGKIPQFLSITKNGSLITGKYSADGIIWSTLFSLNESLPDCVNIGLYVFSPFTGPEVRAFFEFLEITPTSEVKFYPETSVLEFPEPEVYPNPFNHEINIKFIQDWEKLEWIDLNGKMIKKVENSGKNISTGDLQSGVYFLRIFSGYKIWVKKIIKAP